MAKKKAAKRPAKKTEKKPARKPAKRRAPAKKAAKRASKVRIPTASRRVPRSRKPAKSAGSVEVVRPPMVDMTPEIKKDVIIVKPEVVKAEPKRAPVEKHEEFAKALTQEPEKKGFFSRLFGR